jgi:hypothetical protein
VPTHRKALVPKTAHGKTRASRNAHQLGLSLPVLADPVLSDQVNALAREIAGEVADDHIFALASRIAEAQIGLQRVRQARHQLLSDRLKDFGQARSSNKALAPNAASQEPHKLATILMQESQEMKAIDRYERRALSRRRFAIRAFDVERQRKPRNAILEIFRRTKPNNSENTRGCRVRY